MAEDKTEKKEQIKDSKSKSKKVLIQKKRKIRKTY